MASLWEVQKDKDFILAFSQWLKSRPIMRPGLISFFELVTRGMDKQGYIEIRDQFEVPENVDKPVPTPEQVKANKAKWSFDG